MKQQQNYKVLFCSFEVAPFAKVGGLADVVGSLPKELLRMGIDARIIIPRYEHIDLKKIGAQKIFDFSVQFGGSCYPTAAYQCQLPRSNVPVYLLEQERWLSRGTIYGTPTNENETGYIVKRALFFSYATLIGLSKLNFQPQVIHIHDWQTAAVAPLLKSRQFEGNYHGDIKSLLTLHNLDHQQYADRQALSWVGLDLHSSRCAAVNNNGEMYVNLLGQGILDSDAVNTVSPRYAREIVREGFGHGLEQIIRTRPGGVAGILNGIDVDVFNPKTDTKIVQQYEWDSIEKKSANKKSLQTTLSLKIDDNAVLCGVVTRLAHQKGVELVIAAIRKFAGSNFQFVILGEGEAEYTQILSEISRETPESVAFLPRFDLEAAQMIYAGSDIFLMPSKFEPCGLGQMIAMRYGTLPVVRDTGGLHDTVIDWRQNGGQGFLFQEFEEKACIAALEEAGQAFARKDRWRKLQHNAMAANYSWERSANAYDRLYRELLDNH